MRSRRWFKWNHPGTVGAGVSALREAAPAILFAIGSALFLAGNLILIARAFR